MLRKGTAFKTGTILEIRYKSVTRSNLLTPIIRSIPRRNFKAFSADMNDYIRLVYPLTLTDRDVLQTLQNTNSLAHLGSLKKEVFVLS